MWAFQYKHGDKPLEGYTIQRAAGRGGFGEVYYAISDSGREVALKVVQGYEQIELRGISQCMNLKSPHLVTIFDVRKNHENKPFVIMEFVSGPNLRQIMDESPAGVGTQKAAFFLREIAKGLSFLHDCGIVHRDLKPANIFYENGYVKIGDYGLSKAIATSQHSGQTVTVGTVHYMAPEIGAGKYDRGIDIYAMGAVLFEMLTGMPPFLGASPSEVLMKHLATEPDLSGVPQPFAKVIKKAMAKDPTQRYQHIQEMVEDVFGAEHVRQSVSVFSPEDLSIVAERVAKKATVGAGGGSSGPSIKTATRPDVWQRLGSAFDHVGGAASAGDQPQAIPGIKVSDPLQARHRWMLAGLVSFVACVAGTVVSMRAMGPPIVSMLFIFTSAWGAALGVFIASRTIVPRMHGESPFLQKVVIGLIASVVATVLSLPTWAFSIERSTGVTLAAIMLPLIFVDTRKWFAHDRADRVQLGPIFAAAFCGFLANIFLKGSLNLVLATLAGAAMLVQILAPWDPIAGAATKTREEKEEEDEEEDEPEPSKTSAARPAHGQDAKVVTVDLGAKIEQGVAQFFATEESSASTGRYWFKPVWRFARLCWLGGVVIFLTLGVMFCVAGGLEKSLDDTGPLVAAGVGSFIIFLLCFLQSLRKRFYGWWGYLIKPLVMAMCVIAITSSAIVLGNYPGPLDTEEAMLGAFFIVFPSIVFVALLFVPGKHKIESSESGKFATPVAPASGSAATIIATPKSAKSVPIQKKEAPLRERDWPAWIAARAQRRRENFGTFLAGIAGLFILAAVLVSLALAFDTPGMIAAGFPDATAAEELQKNVFIGVSDWPIVLTKIATAGSILLLMIGLVLLTWARRADGVGHMIRGVIGAAGLVLACSPLNEAFRHSGTWLKVAAYAEEKKVGQATEAFTNQLQSGAAIASAAMFLVFLILLAWPAPRRRRPRAHAIAVAIPDRSAPSPAPEHEHA